MRLYSIIRFHKFMGSTLESFPEGDPSDLTAAQASSSCHPVLNIVYRRHGPVGRVPDNPMQTCPISCLSIVAL